MNENFDKIPQTESECTDCLNEILTAEEKDYLLTLNMPPTLYTVIDKNTTCSKETIAELRAKLQSSESDKFGYKLYRWLQNNWKPIAPTIFGSAFGIGIIEDYIHYLKVKTSYNVAAEFEQFYKNLDDMLSDEDKNAILCSNNIFEFHSTLGKWIRNNWIYSNKQLNTVLYYMHPDDISLKIISGYQQHLRTKNNK